MLTSIQINADAKPDNTPAPAANIVETPNGVQVQPPAGDVPAGEQRPTWLPEKFKSVEDMAAAYGELEKKLGTSAEKPGETPAGKPAVTPPAVTTAAAKAGIDMAALSAEFTKDGKLSDASLAQLTAAGITPAQVAAYADGQKAIAAQLVTEVAAVAGGPEQLKGVLEWARANLSADETAAYDAAVDSGNVSLVKMAMQGIVAQYTADVGKAPTLVNGEQTPASGGVVPFTSNAQIVEAMKDPKYSKDPAYRAAVRARLAVSNFGA